MSARPRLKTPPRLSARKVRVLERDGVLTFVRPAGPRPPERPRKARLSAPRRTIDGERALSIPPGKELTRAERFDWAADAWGAIAEGAKLARPKKFSECKRGPCPWVSCRHHLYLDVNEETGAVKLNFPGLEPWELKETCARRVARKVMLTGEETSVRGVAKLLNVTDERIRQIETGAIVKLKVLLADESPELVRALLTRGG